MKQIELTPADLEALDAAIAEKDFYEFVKLAWHVVEPGKTFRDNWHIYMICQALERVQRRELRRVIINIPPRCMKSTIISVMFPVWCWLQDPTTQFLSISHAANLSTRDALKSRRLLQSPWFQRHWGDLFTLTSDQNQKTRYENDKRGYRIAMGMTSGITGEGGDIILIDDPHDRDSAHSELERASAITTFDEAISTRLNDPATGCIVVIMQRLHEEDLTGHLVAGDETWHHVMLPMRHEEERHCEGDPRTKEGELLWPGHFTEQVVSALEVRLGSYGAAGQLQQRPSPKGGGIWKPDTHIPPLKRDGEHIIAGGMRARFNTQHRYNVCDLASSATKMADWTSIVHFGGDTESGALMILGVTRFRVDALGTAEAAEHRYYVKQARERAKASYTVVEDGFFASRIIERMKQDGEPVRNVAADKNKIARAMDALPVAESGNLYADKEAPWWEALSAELKRFRGGDEKNDQADCIAYGCLHWRDMQTGGQAHNIASNALAELFG
jgi:predicted phage terminase large subunit-like protein